MARTDRLTDVGEKWGKRGNYIICQCRNSELWIEFVVGVKANFISPQVEIEVNGNAVPYFMKVGEAGEAFFVFETEHEVPEEYQTSPILQALAENGSRADFEEPSFLDISEKRDDKVPISTAEKKEDWLDEDEDDTKEHMPAELQSPKMIIEEQLDKVVTKIEQQKTQTKNNLYSMEDGSHLLERVVPESIMTTIIAKERFIVRPLNGDIHGLWMDVTHTALEDVDEASEERQATSEPVHEDKESIVLDISGYKTQRINKDENSDEGKEAKKLVSVNADTESAPPIKEYKADKPTVLEEYDLENIDGDVVQIEAGKTYRIEMSLCGFSALGYDQDENRLLFNDKQVSYDTFVHNPSILNDPKLVFRYNDHYFAASNNSPLFTSLLIFKKPLDHKDASNHKSSDSRDTYSYGRGWRQWLSRSSSAEAVSHQKNEQQEQPMDQHGTGKDYQEQTTFTTTMKTTSVGWTKEQEQESSVIFAKRKNYAKTLRLTSDQLKNFNLKKGVNTISFSVSSAYQGKATCVAKVFYWDCDTKVVISDIDGTITKSDAMGHLMTMIGKDWTHAGVAQLYTDIANNGYHFLYLTSRAIGQADYTRDYLKNILQDNYQLPEGPVIMSPDRLFTSLHREVIIRKPEVFKMACLKDIQRLFGDRGTFYAGFGNRITDAISYRSVNVPSSRIFTIDPQGDVKMGRVAGFKSSYVLLNDLVDQIFPPINKTIKEEYSDYNFWKSPVPKIDIPELEEEGPIPTSPKPKPIKPDPINSLPKESIVDYEPEPKRGLLRSFTSRSSQQKPVKKSSISSLSSTSKVPAFHSAPNLTETKDLSKRSVGTENKEDVLPSARSLPDDMIVPAISQNNAANSHFQPASASSGGIMSKVMGGVFSRKPTPEPVTKSNKPNDINYYKNDDEIDDLDELDLDDIPFIYD
ncbi:Lipin/Ned1/Smp2-domain-containing protein [Gilbertella persicaria]|uniref:Lipin/Ned1/Smp2-domain-containing protein n=1 Tax=Gilbertella persicaria TaxID=101096 RepID=UPI00221E6CFC|nr:Lipin/Ned1/Smp2-domain-containing protein [Gilbertella persicaria]KAI8079684.1 Lipin/Ned1/Smp2-domain-containing protein [Gilbertella persicaria]